MGDMGDTITNSMGDHAFEDHQFLSCALFICSTQQIFDEVLKQWGGGLKECGKYERA